MNNKITISSIQNVPTKPGVYFWKNEYGLTLYVGKAKNLKKRMTQYIQGSVNSYKTQKMMQLISKFDYLIASSEKEAFLLERHYISKLKPSHNIKLKDDKKYPYIKIQLQKKQLKIHLVFRIVEKNPKTIYFGPFPSGYGARKMSNFLNRIAVYKKGLPFASTDEHHWEQKFKEVQSLIFAKKSLIKILKTKMEEAVQKLQFEIAQDIKETLNAIRCLDQKQIAEINDFSSIDVISTFKKSDWLSITQFFYRQGTFLVSKNNIVEIITTEEDALRQFVAQYYNTNMTPNILLTNKLFESDLNIVIPHKGIKKQIVKIAYLNARDHIENNLNDFIEKQKLILQAIQKLSNLLKLKKLDHILMIDNSSFGRQNLVSTIVSYRNGFKFKSEYKKYKLDPAQQLSDTNYMKQTSKRYFSNKLNPIPSLFIVDGGIAQIHAFQKYAPKNLKVVGLVKDDKHQTKNLIDDDGKHILLEDLNLFNFLKGIQIEVDRFAKSFFRQRAIKNSLQGKLKLIKGIGAATEKNLLNHFKTYAAIYNAPISELEKIVSSKMASIIYKEVRK